LIDCLSSDTKSFGEDVFTKRMQKLDDRTHLQEARRNMDAVISERFRDLASNPKIVEGIGEAIRQVAIFDIRSGIRPYENPITQFKTGLLVRFLFSCLIDADRINTADFESPEAAGKRLNGKYSEWNLLIDRLESHLQKFTDQYPIDEFRRRISDQCSQSGTRDKGIFTLTVPTGGGKTLASLRFALRHAQRHEMDRVIYVIPFTSIIDQNADVVRKIFEPSADGVEPGSIVLEHHSNITPEEQTWKSKILSENWDAPVVYTTNVQLLETLFGAGTRGARRMHQLANAVLVFDEIQTLPVNCIHLFCNAINFLVEHCGSTVVLCTATQPLLNKVEPSKGALRLADHSEIMTGVSKLFEDLKRVEVINKRKPGGWTNEEIACLALEEVEHRDSCLVIVNTKRSAQALYQLCQSAKLVPTYHLRTNMCAAHRKQKLREIRERLDKSERLLCISTQLIEAGVDIDFGVVIRFIAGLDSIAQAAGRCNRNGRPRLGRVHIVNPNDEFIDRLIDIGKGRDITARLLDEYEKQPDGFSNDLLGPDAMGWYFNYYFFERRGDMDYPVVARTVGHDDTLLNLLSVNPSATQEFRRSHGVLPNLYLRQSFMAAAKAFKAIDAPTRGVIVPYGEEGKAIINELCAAFAIEKEFGLLRKAQQYTVNVFPHELQGLREAHAVHEVQEDTDILYLDARYYAQEFGLSLTPTADMEVLYV
jgi:CRISPR-associated endonuclease/helicase Cas3